MTNALIHIFIRDAENTGDSRVREKFGVLSGAVGLACHLFLFALKLIIGLLTGSISIAADAFNNLSDGLSCLISIVGFKVSGKEPDAKHPFGYGRTEYIAGLIVSFIIILVGFEFFKTSLDRILHPAVRTHRVYRGTDRLVHHHSGRLRVLQNLARPHSASGCRSVLGGADGDSCRIHAG